MTSVKTPFIDTVTFTEIRLGRGHIFWEGTIQLPHLQPCSTTMHNPSTLQRRLLQSEWGQQLHGLSQCSGQYKMHDHFGI